jgi:hypothetical protein
MLCLLAGSSAISGGLIAHWAFSSPAPVLAAPSWSARKYYLTKAAVQGDNALGACSGGYHMANMAEILEPSVLQYDTTIGFMNDDSGSGPPWGQEGWARTGQPNSGNLAAAGGGGANCSVWSSSSHTQTGSLISLGGWQDSDNPNQRIFFPSVLRPWISRGVRVSGGQGPPLSYCDRPVKVWCVQD